MTYKELTEETPDEIYHLMKKKLKADRDFLNKK